MQLRGLLITVMIFSGASNLAKPECQIKLDCAATGDGGRRGQWQPHN